MYIFLALVVIGLTYFIQMFYFKKYPPDNISIKTI